MPISKELMLAILAMDSYNRGYNAGIVGPNGSAQTGLGLTGQIGNATINANSDVLKDANGNRLDVPASFFAISYSFGDNAPAGLANQKVVSYRGTDEISVDLSTGYPIGAGLPSSIQGNLALDFYRAVAGGTSVDPRGANANITITGHSMGGGLGGYVASLYGKTALLYDPMPFQNAAAAARYGSEPRPGVDEFGNPIDLSDAVLRERIYGIFGQATALWGIKNEDISTYYIPNASYFLPGNNLDLIRPDSSLLKPYKYNLPPDVPLTATLFNNRFGQRHDSALIVIRMFMDPGKEVTRDWKDAAKFVLPALFDDDIALKAGYDPTSTNGSWNPASKMMGAIAYTALDEGTAGGFRPFGDKGIRALLDDANELGRIVAANAVDGLVALSPVQQALAKIIVQFAGDAALAKQNAPKFSAGVMSLDNGKLLFNLDPELWTSTKANTQDGPGLNVVGVKELADLVIKNYGGSGADLAFQRSAAGPAFADAIQSLTRAGLIVASGNLALDAAGAAAALTGGPGGALLIGAGGKDTLAGGDGRDLLFG
ncbi:MAG: hypothetical protein IOD03_22400, partial [Methylocystis sp.]|nr:hypothetical protein [Methylocystis sp.]